MGKVYAQAIILALIGLALALTDRSVRPTPGVESPGQTNTQTNNPTGTPPVKPNEPGTAKPIEKPTEKPVEKPVTPAPSADPALSALEQRIETDRHALAVLVYMYLLYRHPLRGRNGRHCRTA